MGDAFSYYISRQIYPSAARAILIRSLASCKNHYYPSEYAVFGLAKRKSVIFNFNVDGFGDICRLRHYVLYPHGNLGRYKDIVHSDLFNKYIEYLQQFNGDCLDFGVLLPGKESLSILDNMAYRHAEKLFSRVKYLVIVGYSFGGFSGDERKMDDLYSVQFFESLLQKHRKPIIVVDKNADALVDFLKERFNQSSVYGIQAYWRPLSYAKLELHKIKTCFPHEKQKFKIDLEYLYHSRIDKYGLD